MVGDGAERHFEKEKRKGIGVGGHRGCLFPVGAKYSRQATPE